MRLHPGNSPIDPGARPGSRFRATARRIGAADVGRAPLSKSLPSLLALWLIVAAPLASQGFGRADNARQGFWVGGGLGQGHTMLSCGICGGDDRASGGLSGYLRAGATLSPRLLLGAEVTAWRGRGDPVSERLYSGAASGWYYPHAEHGWFIKFGVGWSQWRASEGEQALTSSLFSLTAGSGYEMRVNPVLSVVPFINLLASPAGNLNRETGSGADFRAERVATDFRLFVFQVGVGLVRH